MDRKLGWAGGGGADLDWWGLLDTVGKGIEDRGGSDGDGWVGMVMHVIWVGRVVRMGVGVGAVVGGMAG